MPKCILFQCGLQPQYEVHHLLLKLVNGEVSSFHYSVLHFCDWLKLTECLMSENIQIDLIYSVHTIGLNEKWNSNNIFQKKSVWFVRYWLHLGNKIGRKGNMMSYLNTQFVKLFKQWTLSYGCESVQGIPFKNK